MKLLADLSDWEVMPSWRVLWRWFLWRLAFYGTGAVVSGLASIVFWLLFPETAARWFAWFDKVWPL